MSRFPRLPVLVGPARNQATDIAANIASALRTGGRPHHLISGGPGFGKSHVLQSVLASIPDLDDLALVLLPSPYGMVTHADLLFEALYSADAELARTVGRSPAATFELEDAIGRLAGDRGVLLVLDDIDQIFCSLTPGAQGNLRAWVETSANVSILASASLMTTPLASRAWPWFGAFNPTTLGPLDQHDAAALAGLAAGSPSADAFPALYDQLGGTPRVWAVAAERLATAHGPHDPDSDLRLILDGLTPWLLPRVNELSALPVSLLVALARRAEPATVTTLASDVEISNQSAAAVLGRLSRAGWVRSRKSSAGGDRRSTFYSFADPSVGALLRLRDRSRAARQCA
ncbi:helix-turn-helix domain-containing protein [Mycolicibacterium llatzerense]|uniref:helix-turn-helix domain-containing protein n=1 Tax=Mycolicibacterium llatzerense TaxID=280871 RepID=UPI0021B6956A|nr:helix-turn-helix domain-containing protein [Mycolicibacterium llatzerense]